MPKSVVLQVVLGGVLILRDISLTLDEKSFVGVIGRNGCGKTTLLRVLYRSLLASGGSVELLGGNINSYSRKESARWITVLPQEQQDSADFRVFDVVMASREPYQKILGFEKKATSNR